MSLLSIIVDGISADVIRASRFKVNWFYGKTYFRCVKSKQVAENRRKNDTKKPNVPKSAQTNTGMVPSTQPVTSASGGIIRDVKSKMMYSL